MSADRTYLCIDLKSFYASVECMERGMDPMTTNLVVADISRTEKTICLAVSPSLKVYGIPGRARLFEVVQRVRLINAQRQRNAPNRTLSGESYDAVALRESPQLALSYLTAPPQMARYLQYSTRIYQIYLKFIAPEDIHVYSIDEVFLDVTNYLTVYGLSPRQLAQKMIGEVLAATGITAAAGIGTNLYLAKVAMDIEAKHAEPDACGVRIAELTERSYRQKLWTHRPLTDFWRIGQGYSKKLKECGLRTMGDIARCSLEDADLLYKLFGIYAELLIDHAWGWEPCTMAEIKAYKPQNSSICSGQVLQCPYPFAKAKLIVREMTELLALDLAEKNMVTDQLTLTIGYDRISLTNPEISRHYTGAVTVDGYGRRVPKHAHGTANLDRKTSSVRLIADAVMTLFDRIVHDKLLVRRVTLTACRVVSADTVSVEPKQLDLFMDHDAEMQRRAKEETALEREKQMQQTVLAIRKKFGKNAILKGMNLEEGATTIQRNRQIGGHKA